MCICIRIDIYVYTYCTDPSYMHNWQCAYMCILYGALLRKSKNIDFLDIRTLLTRITHNVQGRSNSAVLRAIPASCFRSTESSDFFSLWE